MSLHSSAFRLMLLLAAATSAALASAPGSPFRTHRGTQECSAPAPTPITAAAAVAEATAYASYAPPALATTDGVEQEEPIGPCDKDEAKEEPRKPSIKSPGIAWQIAEHCYPALTIWRVCPPACKNWVYAQAETGVNGLIAYYQEAQKHDALPGDEAAEEPPAVPKEESCPEAQATPNGVGDCAVPIVSGFGGSAVEEPKESRTVILVGSSENCRGPVCPRCVEDDPAPAPVVETIPNKPEEVEVITILPTEVVTDELDEEAAAKEPPIDLIPVNSPCPAAAYASEESQSPESTCPYLQQKKKEAEQPAPSPTAIVLPGDTLENIERLILARDLLTECEKALKAKELAKAQECFEKAKKLCPGSPLALRAEETMKLAVASFDKEASEEAEQAIEMAKRMFHKADHYRLKGKFAKAEQYYRLVEELCPESKLAHRAAAELKLLGMLKAEKEAAAEEAEPKKSTDEPGEIPLEPVIPEPISAEAAPKACVGYGNDATQLLEMLHGKDLIISTVDERVANAVKEAQEALADGHYEQADEAAHLALSLDCECVAAQELVAEARKLLDEACDSGCHTDRGACEKTEEATDASGLRHTLPKVDPKLIEAMDAAEEESEHHGVDLGVIKTGIQLDPEWEDGPPSRSTTECPN